MENCSRADLYCRTNPVSINLVQFPSCVSPSCSVPLCPVPSLSVLSHHPYYIVIPGPASAGCVTLWLNRKYNTYIFIALFFIYFRITKQNKTYTPPHTHTLLHPIHLNKKGSLNSFLTRHGARPLNEHGVADRLPVAALR